LALEELLCGWTQVNFKTETAPPVISSIITLNSQHMPANKVALTFMGAAF